MGALKLGVGKPTLQSAVTNIDRVAMYDRYSSIAYGIILQIIPQHEQAQNVLVDLFASPDLEACVKSYPGSACDIIRLARAKALEARANVVPSISSLPDQFPGLNDMSPKSVFSLCFYQGHKPEAVAEQLNIPYTNILKAIRNYFQYLRTS